MHSEKRHVNRNLLQHGQPNLNSVILFVCKAKAMFNLAKQSTNYVTFNHQDIKELMIILKSIYAFVQL